MSKVDTPRYRFGPLEKRGVLAGFAGSQLLVLFSAGVVAVIALRSFPAFTGFVLAALIGALGALLAFVPIAGRTVDGWLPVVGDWIVRGRRRFVSPRVTSGTSSFEEESSSAFPASLRDISLISHHVPSANGHIGVIKDRRAGTYTGVLSVRGKSFALLDSPEKARRLASWASILSGLAREGGAVHRVQWVERTVPDAGNEIGQYLKDNIAVPVDSPIARSYLEVVDQASPVTQEHEVLVALQVHAGRARRAIKAAGGGDQGACEVLRRELASLSASLMSTEVAVEGALTPRLVAKALRTAFDPGCRRPLASIASKKADRDGTSVMNAGPLCADEAWSMYRSDGACHATYWIAEWPRIDADPDFLAPLLLRTEAMRTISLTMEPVSPLRALRSVENARASAAADEELRERAGFVTTTRRRKEQDSLADHERDLSDGHAFYRFSGFVTVTAATKDDLTSACGEIEEAAGRCFLDIRKLFGEQERAFTYTLPLCRGLR